MENKRPWLDHYPEQISTTINYDEKPLYQFLLDSAEKYPAKNAIHFMGKRISFQELLSKTKKFAQFLQSKGIRVCPIKPETDKETRLTGITHLLENGTVLLPNQQDGDLVDFFDELFKFPNSTFKDMVDSFSQGIRYIDNEYISGAHGYF